MQGAPALAGEVVSDSRVDCVQKRDVYARFGIPEYWVIDPDAARVEIYRLDGDQYAKPETLEAGDELTFGAVPGLRISLHSLFER